MAALEIELLRGRVGGDAALELAFAGALLDAVAHRHAPPAMRLYRPPPTVAFGRQERFAAGFPAAAAAARSHGFTPVLRAPGGHAAAYDEGALVIDEVIAEPDSIAGIQERFGEHAHRQAEALRRLGVEAKVGRVPGEYCPGDFTISADGARKLIGTAQRVVSGGWLFSTVVIVEGAARIRAVLEDVYLALGLDWDPRTAGAVAEEVAGVGVGEIEQALLASYAGRFTFTTAVPRPEVLAAAARSLARYAISSSPAP